MTIQEITHQPERHIKSATIHLGYDEIRDIANMLCSVSKDEKYQTSSYKQLHRDFFLLFEIVKNGCIDGFTCEHLYELHNKIKEENK